MKSLFFLASLVLLSVLFTACGGSAEPETVQKNFLDSLYNPARYRAMLDSMQSYENLSKAEMDEFKAFMRENGDFVTGEWSYGDIHNSAQGYAKMMGNPIEMTINGLTPRTDRKIVEFRFELDFTNATQASLRRFHGELVTLDKEGNEIDRSPRFAVDKSMEPGGKSGELRLQYAYYRPTGNEMNQPKNEAQRRKVDSMLELARNFDAKNYRLETPDLLLDNGMTVREYWRQSPTKRGDKSATQSWPGATGLFKWADKNNDWIQKVRNSVSRYYLCTTPVLTDKYESTHGPYLIFDRIDKFNGWFKGQKKVPGSKITSSTSGKMVLNDLVDFWGWPMEVRVYER